MCNVAYLYIQTKTNVQPSTHARLMLYGAHIILPRYTPSFPSVYIIHPPVMGGNQHYIQGEIYITNRRDFQNHFQTITQVIDHILYMDIKLNALFQLHVILVCISHNKTCFHLHPMMLNLSLFYCIHPFLDQSNFCFTK